MDAPRFIADQNVGRLSRWLRMLGFDTLFFDGRDDGEMVRLALDEGRVILTRDTHIMERKIVTSGRLKAILLVSDRPEEQIRQVTNAFWDLKNTIPGIVSFEYGVNSSPEAKNHGFTHVYLLTFVDAKARDTYLPHAEHKKFGGLLAKLGILEDVFVIDYAPKN